MADRIHRLTMFKIPKLQDQHALIEKYKELVATNSKDGKPYILSTVVGLAEPDLRAQGFTLVSKTEFASPEDMRFYEDICPAHNGLKQFCRTLTIDDILTIYFRPSVVGSATL